MTTVNIYDMAQTWNNAAVTFDGIKLNVTDTASAAGSLLLNLQVGGVTRANVRKDGAVFASLYSSTSGDVGLASNGAGLGATVGTTGVKIRALGGYTWADSTNLAAAADLFLLRDAANTLAQRNGVNAQTQRWYETFTDASNNAGFEVVTGATTTLRTFANGTGTKRNIVLDGANRAAHIADPSGGGTVDAEARTAINAILVALESHGLVAAA